jgi:hypothetical protein
MLDHRTAGLVARLRELASDRTVVLLDYTTNGDVTDLSRHRFPTRRSSRSASKHQPKPDPFKLVINEKREGQPSDTAMPTSGQAGAGGRGR